MKIKSISIADRRRLLLATLRSWEYTYKWQVNSSRGIERCFTPPTIIWNLWRFGGEIRKLNTVLFCSLSLYIIILVGRYCEQIIIRLGPKVLKWIRESWLGMQAFDYGTICIHIYIYNTWILGSKWMTNESIKVGLYGEDVTLMETRFWNHLLVIKLNLIHFNSRIENYVHWNKVVFCKNISCIDFFFVLG
jgi:hypothetical protein